MKISFRKFSPESESELLAQWMVSQPWPFHVFTEVSRETVLKSIQDGNYTGDSNQTFWILNDLNDRVGLIRLFEMDDLEDGDGAPLFDIRILNQFQGQSMGQYAVSWLTEYLYKNWPALNRIEGTTRVDNISMRKVFRNCGYVKEGHYRQSWPAQDGKVLDTVRYAILRQDWQSGQSTQVNWADE